MNKQFVFIVMGSQIKVDTAIELMLKTNTEIRSMCAYGGGFMGGAIGTYFVCIGKPEELKNLIDNHIHSFYNDKVSRYDEQLRIGKIAKFDYDEKIREYRTFNMDDKFIIPIIGD